MGVPEPLVLGEQGASEVAIPLLLVVVAAGRALGGLLADRVAGWSNARIGWIIAGAGLCLAGGALSGEPAGIVAVGVGYGALHLGIVVSDGRLQDCIRHGARATVTSVAGLLAEVMAVVVFAGFARGSLASSLRAGGHFECGRHRARSGHQPVDAAQRVGEQRA